MRDMYYIHSKIGRLETFFTNSYLQIVGEILGRRKLKRGYEYEVNWKGQPMDKNEWLTRDQLEEMGWGKTLNDIDIKEAAKQGLVSRPLTGNFVYLDPRVAMYSCIYLKAVIAIS